jgi:hypothetical protein
MGFHKLEQGKAGRYPLIQSADESVIWPLAEGDEFAQTMEA